ncbi:MAG: hypothetical protein ACYTGL_02570 [Planctomycetota bacterium]|jgi:hypothetical protein
MLPRFRCRILSCLVVLTAVSGSVTKHARVGAEEKPAAPTIPPPVRINVSPQTTFFTEPLLEDGRVDLVAALNRRAGEGITATSNAAVVLYEVYGPEPDGTQLSDEFYSLLGIQRPAANGDYFISYGKWLQGQAASESIADKLDSFSETYSTPWTAEDRPQLHSWLQAMAGPLGRLETGLQRPDYFLPMVPPKNEDGTRGGLVATLLPGVQISREVGRALVSRAMLHLGEGRHADAWQDLLTVHRLGRHIGRGQCLIERLVGIALESIAIEADLTWLAVVQPSTRRIDEIRRQLAGLPEAGTMADAIDSCERTMFVDSVILMTRNQLDLGLLGGNEEAIPKLFRMAAVSAVDWNAVLQDGNEMYDRITAAMRLPERRERQAAGKLALSLIPGLTSAVLTDSMSAALISLLMPAAKAARHAQDREEQKFASLLLTLTLLEARNATGEFPETLDDLVPMYVDTVPIDLFSGKPLKYRRTENEFEFYSVGRNTTDDGGRSFGDENPGDDLVVRLTLPETGDN